MGRDRPAGRYRRLARLTRVARGQADVAFLWLGEMLLIPHLWPIIDALARARPDLAIDIWVSTSVHEALIRSWIDPAHGGVRVRRAPGFACYPDAAPGENVPLPAKLPMLARLAPKLAGVKVAVCSEQTSLWLPRLLPLRTRFIFTVHGAGPLNYDRARRLACVHRLMISSALDAPCHVAHGVRPERIAVTGYAKASFRRPCVRKALFADERPILLYTPHWQRHRSSWPDWGRTIVAQLAAQRDWNVILAPHQRLMETEGVREALAAVSDLPHVHVDTDSFAMVDGSYTAAADLYLGDTSSQILEYLVKPRPCLLLRPPGLRWRGAGSGDYWQCGEVVERIEVLGGAIARAAADHARYRDAQTGLVTAALGDTSAAAPERAAAVILEALG